MISLIAGVSLFHIREGPQEQILSRYFILEFLIFLQSIFCNKKSFISVLKLTFLVYFILFHLKITNNMAWLERTSRNGCVHIYILWPPNHHGLENFNLLIWNLNSFNTLENGCTFWIMNLLSSHNTELLAYIEKTIKR